MQYWGMTLSTVGKEIDYIAVFLLSDQALQTKQDHRKQNNSMIQVVYTQTNDMDPVSETDQEWQKLNLYFRMSIH